MRLSIPKPAKRGAKPPKRISRGKAPNKKRNTPRARASRAGDARWRRLVKKQAGGLCERCRRPRDLDGHHVWPKSHYPHLRHDLANGIALCRECHDYAHASPPAFRHWWRRAIGLEAYERLFSAAMSPARGAR